MINSLPLATPRINTRKTLLATAPQIAGPQTRDISKEFRQSCKILVDTNV